MLNFSSRVGAAAIFLFCLALTPLAAHAASDPCPRPAQGSVIGQPPDLYSKHGVLNVKLGYFTTVDQWGRTLFCYATPDGSEAPTLHVFPGDTINIQFTNQEENDAGKDRPSFLSLGSGVETLAGPRKVCADSTMSSLSANIHFHGLNISPKCHSDEVIFTLVNPGTTYNYRLKIPADEPPGMYWYHAHVHGIASPAVQGGASGAIEVEGIGNYQPAVQGLPQRFLAIRDQPLQNPPLSTSNHQPVPFWDVSLNYVPVPFPSYPPGIIQMKAGAQEFWRVVNASADTIMDLQLVYDGVAQPLQLAALDGVPIGSQEARHQGYLLTRHDVYIPPAGRAEFIVTGPASGVKNAVFLTRAIDTGPAGDIDTQRPLAQIQLTDDARRIPPPVRAGGTFRPATRFGNVTDAMVTAHRTLYFIEYKLANGKSGGSQQTREKQPWGGMAFYITVRGQNNVLYEPTNPPAVVTHQGAVEDWTIQNRSGEVHEFHIHQIHFQLLEVNGKPVPPKQRQWYDTYQVGYWTGKGKYPSIKVRMDFRGAIAGEFVYHCHILDHEDGGMMANILVKPATQPYQRHARTSVHLRQAGGSGANRARNVLPART